MAKKTWMGTPPEKCDICNRKITRVFIDGKTDLGPWAIMCPACYKVHGIGLGLGLGQRYVKQSDRWVKVEG